MIAINQLQQLRIIDPNQFGAVLKSSIVHARVSKILDSKCHSKILDSSLHALMIHLWAQATGAPVRVVVFDYKKAFNLMDQILFQKIPRKHSPQRRAWVGLF